MENYHRSGDGRGRLRSRLPSRRGSDVLNASPSRAMTNPGRTCFALNWQLGRHAAAAVEPDVWVAAQVPGAVQLDWGHAHGFPDFTIGGAVQREWADLDESWWTYRARIETPPAREDGARLFLVVEGVDYAGEVFLDGQSLGAIEGLQTRLEFDVTDALRAGSEIRVRVAPAPKSQAEPKDRNQANRSCKPAVSYGWDFHPRLVPLGLWRDAYLETRARVHFSSRPTLSYRLNETCSEASGGVDISLKGAASTDLRLRWTFLAPDGAVVRNEEHALDANDRAATFEFVLPMPELWWPHDQGRPALYRSRVELCDAAGAVLDAAEERVGFRRVRLVMAPEQWKEPQAFPKSRSLPPMTLEVNGRAFFAKGSNWVCPDVFPGSLTPARYAEQLALVRESNLNLLRLWGGATTPHDTFYERCDELGIMVWQEFPLACNAYPDDAAYLAVLDRDSRSLVARLRGHACVVLWCGGNELFNVWSGMTDQSLALRLLNRNCFELDPTRPFLATSPVEGVGHGHYVFRDPISGDEAWAFFQRARCTAYPEFGCPGPASVATLRRILPPEELWPPRPGTAWETHHAFGAWLPQSHLYLAEIEHYFGPAASLEAMVERGQLLQAIGLQGLFEEARRQKPVASMALNWCFNEPWPCAANMSLVGWPCEPKPALRAVAAACRPTLASARIRKFSWAPGEAFEAELWLLHDAPVSHDRVEVAAWLTLGDARCELGTWIAEAAGPGVNVAGPRLSVVLPDFVEARFTLHLAVADRPEWSSDYTLLRARPDTAANREAVTVPQGVTNF